MCAPLRVTLHQQYNYYTRTTQTLDLCVQCSVLSSSHPSRKYISLRFFYILHYIEFVSVYWVCWGKRTHRVASYTLFYVFILLFTRIEFTSRVHRIKFADFYFVVFDFSHLVYVSEWILYFSGRKCWSFMQNASFCWQSQLECVSENSISLLCCAPSKPSTV